MIYPVGFTTITIPINIVDPSTGLLTAPSAPLTTSDFAIYKNGSATHRTSMAGCSIVTGFDSKTGVQMLIIDASDDTDSGFFSAKASYNVLFDTTKTAGGVSLDGRMLSQGNFMLWDVDDLVGTEWDKLKASAAILETCNVDTVVNTHTPTTTVFQSDNTLTTSADRYIGRTIYWAAGSTLEGEAATIEDFSAVGGIGEFTVSVMSGVPANNDAFIIG
jgi:hypothetical protein